MKLQIRIKKKKLSLVVVLYLFMLCINIAAKVIESSNVQNFLLISKGTLIYWAPRISIIGCMLLFFLEKRHSKWKFTLLLIMAVAVFSTFFMAGTLNFAILFVFVSTFPSGLSGKYASKWVATTYALCIGYILLLYSGGFIEGTSFMREGYVRYSFGFVSANAFANTVLFFLLSYVYCRQDEWKYKDSILWSIIIYFVYSYTNSRASALLSVTIIIMMTIFTLFNRKGKSGFGWIYPVGRWSYIVGMLSTLILTYMYSEGMFASLLTALNYFLSYRLSFFAKYFQNPGISLFGNGIEVVTAAQAALTGQRWSGLDNSYLYMLIVWGIFGAIIYTVLLFFLTSYLKKTKNKTGALCLVIIAIMGLTENCMINIGTNLTVIMFAEMIRARDMSRSRYSLRK